MSRTFKFLLDENVDARLATQIKLKDWVAVFTPKGLKNGEVIALAQEKELVLLTNDTDFADSSRYTSIKPAGIIVFRIHPPDIKRLSRVLVNFLAKINPRDLEGKIFVLTDSNIGD
jgi:predicted nuclease of predicted toxin-antitoxin system